MKIANVGGTGDGWWVFNENGQPLAGFELDCLGGAYFYMANAGLTFMVLH